MRTFKKLKDGEIIYIELEDLANAVVYGYGLDKLELLLISFPLSDIDESWEADQVEIGDVLFSGQYAKATCHYHVDCDSSIHFEKIVEAWLQLYDPHTRPGIELLISKMVA